MNPMNRHRDLVSFARVGAMSVSALALFITDAPAQEPPKPADAVQPATTAPAAEQAPASPSLPEVQVIQEAETPKPVEQAAPKPKTKPVAQSSGQASAAKPKKKAASAASELPPEAATDEQSVEALELPPGIRLEPTFGTNVQTTSSGKVIGYRALSSNTATKTGTPIVDTPQSVAVIPRQLLDDQAALTLDDATKNVAGVTSAYGFMGVNNACLRVRGFSTEQGSVGCTYYLDGVRVWAQPVPLAATERIEVVKGPNSVLFGRNEPGGMVNVVTKKPEFERQSQIIEQTVGSFNTSETSIDFGGIVDAAKTLAWRLNAAYSTTDTFRDRVFDNFANVNAAVAWKPSAGTRLDVSLDYSDQRFRPDFGLPARGDRPAPVPITRSYKQDYIDAETEAFRGTVKLEQQLTDGLTLSASYLGAYMEPRYFNVYGYALDESADPLATFYFFEPYSWRRTHQANIDLKGDFMLAGMRHRPIVGFDYNNERYNGPWFFSDAAPTLDLFNPDIGSAPRYFPTRAELTPWGSVQEWYGIYAHDEVHLTDWLIVNAGFRWDEATYAFSTDPVNDAVTDTDVTPRAGVVLKPIPGVSLFAQYQEGFGPGNGRTSGGRQLDSQTATEYEVGTKWTSPDESFLVSLAFYDLRKRNLPTSDPSTPDPSDSIATGEVHNRGIEIDMSGRLTEKLSVVASYAYADAVISKDNNGNEGNLFEGVPEHAGSIWLRYQVDENWALGGGVYAEDERPGDLANSFVLPGYARMDLMAQYRFLVDRSRWTAQLNVNNVFDTEYYAGIYRNERNFIQPGAPREAYFTLRTEF